MAKAKIANKMFPDLPSSRILRQVARLNKISGTPDVAYKFDPKYTKMELLLPQARNHKDSMGLRQFWKHNLPTLKFHNDDIAFQVKKIQTESPEELAKCPTKLIVYENNEKVEIPCHNAESSEILSKLVQITNASSVPEEEIPTINVNTKS